MAQRKIDLLKLNSLTKYPSILTYHKLGQKGRLLDEVQISFNGPAILTEKIDGVNGRIILFTDGFYIIGSREELLYGKGDLIGNPQLGIVDELKPVAETLIASNVLTVYYFEVYGGNVTKGGKQYTGNERVGHLLFDVAFIPDEEELLTLPIEKISAWRELGGQRFLSEYELNQIDLPLTPRIGLDYLPTNLNNTYSWLKTVITQTKASLDEGGMGRPEGIVVRSPNRSRIAKIRFEDYARTMRN